MPNFTMSELSCDMSKLAELLRANDDNSSDSEEDLPGFSKIGPGDIGKRKTHNVSINKRASCDGQQNIRTSDPDAIWEPEEVVNQPVGEEHFDPREQPEYEIKYQQSVSPEDVFLQMNGKTASTASCENMIILIHMKSESKDAIDLTITNADLDIRSPLYRLHLHLPHPVNAEKGRAEWDSKKEVLTVQLLMVRQFDFLNF